ncbi:MAG: hypothetical protein LAO05_06170 [Acidobacteriia bacterium]|nr:hypothetical protein [Terriglobia bacterium]
MSEAKPANPPLFDTMEIQDTIYVTSVTLRDLFAAFALAGLAAYRGNIGSWGDYAAEAYTFADAMLAERERPR